MTQPQPPASASSPSSSPSALADRPAQPRYANRPRRPRAAVPAWTFPYEQFTLPNGLRVIVHTDRKAPIVAVNIWYHVGSKDEPARQVGLRAPVRTPDVPALGKPQGRILRPLQAGRRHRPERHHQHTTAPTTSRTCRPPRSTPRCSWNRTAWATCSARSPGRARRTARRGAEREAPGREPALRPQLRTRW